MRRLLFLTVIVAALGVVQPASAATIQVSITRAGFVPSAVTIDPGDTVTWTNADTRTRQVVSQSAGFASPILQPGDRFSHTYTQAGRFTYEDPLVRPRDRGTVTVRNVGTVTLAAKPKLVTYGRSTVLSGKVSNERAGETVEIFAQACGATFAKIGETKTLSEGVWTLTTKPLKHTNYRAEWGTARSEVVTVRSRPRVRLAKLAPRRFEVTVFAAEPFGGKPVEFQRWNATRRVWVRVKIVTLANTDDGVDPTVISEKRFTSRIRAGLRVRILLPATTAGTCYAPNTSNIIKS
jgi:plastocyanin